MMELLKLPPEVAEIIRHLEEAGYEAYAVGGCVRDALLHRTPEDWDITTSALPQQVKQIFPKTVDTGIAHGTVTVLLHRQGFEVTTYRIDGEYKDGRHPEAVAFTRNLEEDLKRRDFTINAMAYHPVRGLVDLFGGQKDLEHGIIRCVGEAKERFTEDALRILRAVRFAGQLGFSIEEKTYCAMSEIAPNLKQISQERIRVELTKLLLSGHPERLLDAVDTGMTAIVLPELDACMDLPQCNPWHCMDVGRHSMETVCQIRSEQVLRWAALLHDIGKPLVHLQQDGCDHYPDHAEISAQMARTILRRLRFDNHTVNTAVQLIRYHAYHFRQTRACVRKVMSLVGKDLFLPLLELMRADTMAKSEKAKREYLPAIAQLEYLYQQVLERGECYCQSMLAVKGTDLIAAGVAPGNTLGFLLSSMLDWVLRRPQENDKELLLQHFLAPVQVRIFLPEQAEEIHRLCSQYTPEELCMLAEEGCVYTIWDGQTLCGCGAVWPVSDESGEEKISCRVQVLNMSPEHQGKELEKLLLQALESDPQAAGTEEKGQSV